MADQGRLLIVDDEKVALKNLEHVLRKEGYDVVCAQTGQAAITRIGKENFDVVLTDLRMERIDGMQVLKSCRELSPSTEVVMITGFATVDSAVEAMRQGAFSYVAKPYRLDEVRRVVAEALDRVKRRQSLAAMSESKTGDEAFLTRTPALQRVLTTARQVAALDCPVLILGEQGTGRRALARTLHQLGAQADAPFQILRCSAHDNMALEAMLFGSQAPQSGTLLLEEVEMLPAALQARLAMALDLPGGDEAQALKPRLLVSTSADLDGAVKDGAFRQDLHLMLRVVTLTLPPLSQRTGDIPMLALHFLNKACAENGKSLLRISDDALDLLAAYDYPGNVRELDTVIRGAVAVCDGATIEPRHLPPSVRHANREARSNRLQTLEEREREYIMWVLEEVGGNQTLAAKVLGIDRASLWRKLKRYENEKGEEEV
ncbi:Response regulator with CheY-like receiver, AAA-type ATPase, and DNA-binding domains [Rhodospirillaceae bacterium LM-1]|nr:Response regulator with CheY-like receiver, AAA-type ATPase, and DNA-binding domains [Rhodospirillaceae bacterium LM-1]